MTANAKLNYNWNDYVDKERKEDESYKQQQARVFSQRTHATSEANEEHEDADQNKE